MSTSSSSVTKSTNLGALKAGWFSEMGEMWPGQCMSLEIEKTLEDTTSQYQHIQVFETKSYGRMLSLDGCIQLTDRDESAYQEPIAHLPLLSHPNPKKVCVIGGGDGAVITQLSYYKDLESIVLCEIDQGVMDISKKYFPKFLKGWNDSRLKVEVGDGAAYLRSKKGEFDVIIVDSSDPIGPAASLFSKEFFTDVKAALRAGGMVVTQCEAYWIHLKVIKEVLDIFRELFPVVTYAHTSTPTYPCGQIGFAFASLEASPKAPVAKPEDRLTAEGAAQLQYYNADIHVAAFALPTFVKKALGF